MDHGGLYSHAQVYIYINQTNQKYNREMYNINMSAYIMPDNAFKTHTKTYTAVPMSSCPIKKYLWYPLVEKRRNNMFFWRCKNRDASASAEHGTVKRCSAPRTKP